MSILEVIVIFDFYVAEEQLDVGHINIKCHT